MKECNSCHELMSIVDFGKHKSQPDGLQRTCKVCRVIQVTNSCRTVKGLFTRIYATQRNSCKERKMKMPDYTKKWLIEWTTSQENFNELFKDWENSGYLKNKKPSIDRLDNSISYTKTNIQLVTWAVNDALGKELRCHGIPIDKYTMADEYVCSYDSAQKAMESTGINDGTIHHALNGKLTHAGGYKWKYKTN